ncbi:MAG: hypothetical protein ACYDG4_15140 [Desulfuromonadaceae bacterium]
MSACTIGNSTSNGYPDLESYPTMGIHNHAAPSSWTIADNDNNPAYYGLDIIYMDMATWEAYEKRFPDGAVVLSSQVLADAGFMERFTAADGKYISNTTPDATGGVTETKTHLCEGQTGEGGNTGGSGYSGSQLCASVAHHHHISLTSGASTNEPRSLVTRLYEILALTVSAKVGTVVFCDSTPSANWEILTAWTGANLKSGDSDPTLSGSDTHSQTLSGNTLTGGVGNSKRTGGNIYGCNNSFHLHAVSATLQSVSHVPLSVLLMPIKLKVDLFHSAAQRGAQLIGLTW